MAIDNHNPPADSQYANNAFTVVMTSPAVNGDNGHIIETDVLIVGAGPCGLLLAKLLTNLNVRCKIIERYATRLAAPKAHALSPRSLEICRQNGLDANDLRRLGTPRHDAYWVNFVTTLTGERIGRLPYERMDKEVLDSTPEMIHNIAQPRFEEFVRADLPRTVEILRNASFVAARESKNHITTAYENRSNGEMCHITSRYVVACDGAKSKVRSFLGTDCEGEDSYETMMTIHFHADLRSVLKESVGMLHWIADPGVSGFIICYDITGEQVIICNINTHKHPIGSWTDQMAREIVRTAIGADTQFEYRSFRPWVLSRKVAKQYRKGRVFLAGDAAHSFPPTGGLGLNSGLADVHNLAYKLSAVIGGYGHDRMLDTYDAERRHIALVNAQQSVKNGKQIFGLLRALGTTTEDIDAARRNLHNALADPEKRANINAEVQMQQEHFDNLELHIGYVYGSDHIPPNASHFTPKYVPGARLPHVWIHPSAHMIIGNRFPPPTDLRYVEELDADARRARQYSSLDLCAYDCFTVIAPRHIPGLVPDATTEQPSRFNAIPIRIVHYPEDFAVASNDTGRVWAESLGLNCGKTVIVRPDQHILQILQSAATAEDVLGCIEAHLGISA